MALDQQFSTAGTPHQPQENTRDEEQGLMPLGDHLDELRKRLIYCLIGLIPALIVAFIFGTTMVDLLTRPYIDILAMNGYPPTTNAGGPSVGFVNAYLPVVFMAAIIISFPWIIYQLWQFIVVGLYEHERRVIYILAPFSTIMALLGVIFSYVVLIPVSIAFFVSFSKFYPEAKPGNMNWVSRIIVGWTTNAVEKTSELVTDSPTEHTPEALVDIDLTEYQTLPNVAYDPVTPLSGSIWYNTIEDQVKFFSEAHGIRVFSDNMQASLPTYEADPESPSPGKYWLNINTNQVKFSDTHGNIMTLTSTSNRIVTPLPMLDEYIKFSIFMTFGMVLAFQLPVVMSILGKTRLIDPKLIREKRRIALFVIIFISAVLTPADIFSMLFLMIPLYGLFELGLCLMTYSYKMAQANALERELDADA